MASETAAGTGHVGMSWRPAPVGPTPTVPVVDWEGGCDETGNQSDEDMGREEEGMQSDSDKRPMGGGDARQSSRGGGAAGGPMAPRDDDADGGGAKKAMGRDEDWSRWPEGCASCGCNDPI